jgi:hypothetical protein
MGKPMSYQFTQVNFKVYFCNKWRSIIKILIDFLISFNLNWLPLWSSGQSSWLQIQGSGYDSWRYQIFWEVVDLERGPLSLMSTTEELLGGSSSGSGLEKRDYGRRDIALTTRSPLSTKRDTNFADKRRSLGRSV